MRGDVEMKAGIMILVALQAAVLLGLAAPAGADPFDPWEPLVSDAWIYIGPPQDRLIIHTVNAGDYEVGFDRAATGDKARGMNALKFSLDGANTGHLASTALDGSFAVENTGDARTFTDLVILVAIDAEALPPDFAMSLGVEGGPSYTFNPAVDFGFYDHPKYDTGRPSGYYSITSPSSEGVSYLFDQGMVTLYAVEGAALRPSGSITMHYVFENLPGTAVFSVYGHDDVIGWIYHCNRAVLDENNPSKPVSTFEVLQCDLMGDVNGDDKVNGEDVAAFIRVKVGSPEDGDKPACADFQTGTLDGDTAAFIADLLGT